MCNALPSIKISTNGDMLIDSDGGDLHVLGKGSSPRNLLSAPRQFGARIALTRSGAPPSIASSFSFGGVGIMNVSGSNSFTPSPAFPSGTSAGFTCGLNITYSDNGNPLTQLPTCTFQTLATGTYLTLPARQYDVIVSSLTTSSMGIWIVGTNRNAGANAHLECETGDGVVVSCIV